MTHAIKWRAKRDRDGRVIPACWQTDGGYTVAEFRTPEVTYGITRPGESAPCLYTPDRQQVAGLIDADERARA